MAKTEKAKDVVEEIEESAQTKDKNEVVAQPDSNVSAARIAELENQMATLQNLMAQLNVMSAFTQNKEKTVDQEVCIICNFNGGLKTTFPTWSLSMSRFGQKVFITRQQFQELVNTHRKYFEREYILLDSKHIDLAEQLGVPIYDTASKKYMHPRDLEKIAKMGVHELEVYYNDLSEPMKRIFVSWFMNKCCEKDPDFYVVDKMTLLNNLTKGNLFEFLIKLCVSDNLSVSE